MRFAIAILLMQHTASIKWLLCSNKSASASQCGSMLTHVNEHISFQMKYFMIKEELYKLIAITGLFQNEYLGDLLKHIEMSWLNIKENLFSF